MRSRPKPRRGKPIVEELEARETPATFIWDGSASGLWSDPQNWNFDPNNVGVPSDGDDLVFPAGAANLNNNNDLDGLTLNSIAFAANGYVLNGNAITLGSITGGTGFIDVNGAGITDTINFDITLAGAAGNKQFFTVNSLTSVLRINGVISDTSGVELSKDGTGTLILTANNEDFSGPVSIVQGVVNIRHASALGTTANPTTVLYNTTTGQFGQLQIQSIAEPIAEPLVINGHGPFNDGALLNVLGNNTWTGVVTLDSDSTIGANAGSLTIEGVITDLGAGHDLIKEGPARINLDPLGTASGNTYRGQTIVNNGILGIRHSLALGNETTPVVGINDTVVNVFTNRAGTLQLDFNANPARIDPNATATGFTVPFERLTLNGPGVEGIHFLPKQGLPGGATVTGALSNLTGDNTWVQDISLWSGNTAMVFDSLFWGSPSVGIGAEGTSSLYISGRINDVNITDTVYNLIKVGPGRVILAPQDPNAPGIASPNTFRGRTEVLEGYLNIRDSRALGASGGIRNDTIVFPQGTLELEADTIPDSAPPPNAPDGTPHLNTDIVILGGEQISLMGDGAGGDGSLRNLRGTNEIDGNIPLLTSIGRSGVSFGGSGASVGVEPDRAPYAQFDLSQLTLSGVISGANLTKVGAGELVLTDSSNTYTGSTFINEGWITIRHSRSLGADINGPDTVQPATFVAQDAALHFKRPRIAATGDSIAPFERLFASGIGISHRGGDPDNLFPELHQRGAILNLSGKNTLTGIINLVATDDFEQVGIGVDIANSPWVPDDQNVFESTLTITNLTQEALSNQANLNIGIPNPPALIPAGINKLGRKRLILQQPGTFTGDNQVTEGILRVQSDTALGMVDGTTTVLDGAALEVMGYAATLPPPTLAQWANTVIDFSSQFSATSWSAMQATGVPDTFAYGDISTAWAPLPRDGSGPGPALEHITLGFATPVFADGVIIRETLGNGFVRMVEVMDTSGGFTTVWNSIDPSEQGEPVNFAISFPRTSFLVSGVRITVDINHSVGTWEEIDAVLLQGATVTPAINNSINGGITGGIQLYESLVLNGSGNVTADDFTHDFTTPTLVHTLSNLADDNMVRSPITLATDVGIDTKIDSRLSLWKPIDGPGGFHKEGVGKLVLGGVNSYRGDTIVNFGTLNLQSSSALGAQTASERQEITVVGTEGTFAIEFGGDITAPPLAFDASALDVQNALNALPSIQSAGGTVSVTAANGVYTVVFGGDLAGKNLNQMTAMGFDGVTASVATITQGGGGTTVANDAQIELQGDITISGESLTILGNGPSPAPNLPTRWFAQGPSPALDGETVGNGAVTGRITGVAVDPVDPNVMYVSAAGGGAWRTKNGGLTWQPLIDNINGQPLDPNEVLFTGAIAVANSSNIYVALGEANNSPGFSDAPPNATGQAFYGRGVLWSSDYGQTWTLIQPPGNAFDRATISKIVVDPLRPDILYFAVLGNGVNGVTGGEFGIWRLFSNTGTWENLTEGKGVPPNSTMPTVSFTDQQHYADLAVFVGETNTNRIIFFSLGRPEGAGLSNAVYVSWDVNINTPVAPDYPEWEFGGFPNALETVAGVQNQPRNGMIKLTGTRVETTSGGIRTITITTYASITYPDNGPRRTANQAGIFREVLRGTTTWASNNPVWGTSWGATAAQPNNTMQGGPPIGTGYYNSTILVHPVNPDIVFVAGVGETATQGPFISTNGGGAWTNIGNTSASEPHTEYHAAIWDRQNNNGRILVGTDGGIWRLDDRDPGEIQWANLNGNFLQVTQFNGLDVHPFDPFFAVGGAQDNGVIIYDDSFNWNHVENGDGGVLYINNLNPQIMYHVQSGVNGVLRRSTSGGAQGTWSTIFTVPNSYYFPFILDRVNPSRLLIGDRTNLRESLANGDPGTYNLLGSAAGSEGAFGNIISIAVSDRQGPWTFDPNFPLVVDRGADSYDSDTIYVLTTNGVKVTKNHGVSWQTRNNGLALNGIREIIVDPRNRDIAYIVRSVFGGTHVYRTTNAGQNWVALAPGSFPDVPAWSLAVNPRNGDVYAGTDIGVLYLAGGNPAGTWQRFGVGLPTVQVRELVFNNYTNMLSAGTYGRGLYQVWLDDSRSDGGAIRAVTGSSLWSGDIILAGDIDIRAEINATINFAGAIKDGVADADHTINKFGLGRVIFSGVNTYGGLTNVFEGPLTARNPSALGQADVETIVHAGAALELQADLFGETVILNGDGIEINGHNTGALRNVSNFNTFTGTLVLATDSTIGVDSGSQLTIGTTIGDPDGLLNGVGTIVEVNGPLKLTKELTGTLVLNQSNTYTGLTDIIQGIIRVEHAEALGTADAGTDVRNGAQLQVNSDVFGQGITVVDEALRLSGTGIFGSGAILNFGGDNTWQGPVTLTSIAGIPAPPPPVPPTTIAMGANAGTQLTIDGTIDEFMGSFGIIKVGVGKIVFAGEDDNTYSGLTTVQTGILNIQKAGALGSVSVGTVVVNGAALELEDPTGVGIVFADEPLTLNGPGIASQGNPGALRNVDGDNEWTGDITLASSSRIGVDDGTMLTVTGDVGGGAAAALTKVGAGTLVFPNANTYDGATVINQGVLNIRDPQALGDGSPDVNGTTVLDGATLQVQGGITVADETLTLNGLGFFEQGALANLAGNNTWAGPIILASDAGIGVATALDTLTVTGAISDGGNNFGVTKLDPGTLEYAGGNNNEHTGFTIVRQGTLLLNKSTDTFNFDGNLQIGTGAGSDDSAVVRLAQSSQIPDDALTQVFADGLLDLNGFNEAIHNVFVSDGHVTTGAGDLTVNTLTMSGGNVELNDINGTLIPVNRIQASSSGAEIAEITGPGFVDLGNADRVFAISDGPDAVDFRIGASTADLTAIVGIGGGLVKDGDGLMQINTSTSTYDGATTLNEGELRVDGVIVSEVVLSGGTLSGTGAVGGMTFDANGDGGSVHPGTSPGILTSNGDVEWDANTVFFVDLDDDDTDPNTAATPGVDHDQLQINGNLSINGASLTGLVGPGAVTNAGGPGQSFTIITFTGASDGSKFAEGDDVFIQGKKFLIHYNANDVTLERDFSDVTVTVTPLVTALPSPTSVWSQHVVFLIEVVNEDNDPDPEPVFDGTEIEITLSGPHSPATITRTLTGGQYIYDPLADSGIQQLEIGVHTVTVDFLATEDYNAGTGVGAHQVLRADTAIALGISSNPGVFGEDLIITATITALAPGSSPTGIGGVVDFFIDGNPTPAGNDIPVVQVGASFVATFNISTLGLGAHQVTASYNGHDASVGTPVDNHFNPSQTPTPLDFEIEKADSTVTITGVPSPSQLNENVVFTVTVSATAPGSGTPTGSVSIFRDNIFFGTSTLTNGQASFSISTLTIGLHTITATYTGDDNFNFGNGTAQHVVRGNSTTSVTTSLNPSTYGQNVTYRATVAAVAPATGTPTGSVDFVFTLPDNSTLIHNVALVGGVANLVKNDLPAGASMLTANYLGDQVFGGSSATLSANQVVNKANTATTLLASPGSPTVFGQQITFTATVSPIAPGGLVPTGDVEFLDGTTVIATVPLTAGVATFNTSTLSVGSHSITARYVGTSNYNGSVSGAVNRNVNIATTTTSLAVSANPSFYGQEVVTATVAANAPSGATPTGNVVFAVQDRDTLAITNVTVALDSSGVATLPPQPAGDYRVTANYQGTSGFAASSDGPEDYDVDPAPTTLSLASTNLNAVYGEAVITATVNPDFGGVIVPSGQVIFTVNGNDHPATLDQNGVATLPIVLTPGTYTIAASYDGDSNFLGDDDGPITQVVSAADTEVSVVADPTASVFGQGVTFTITVTAVAPGAGIPTGTVDIFDGMDLIADDAPLVDGVVTLTTSTLSVGSHTISAVYAGDGNFNGDDGSVVHVVSQASTATTIVSSQNPSLTGAQVQFDITVAAVAPGVGVPFGTVDVFIGGNLIADDLALVSGAATVLHTFPTAGDFLVEVFYSGDTNFAASNQSLTQMVRTATTTDIVADNSPTVFGEPANFTITVSGIGGPPTGSVDVFDGLTLIGDDVPLVGGVASFQFANLGVGSHTINAIYNGDGVFLTSSDSTTHTVNQGTTTTTLAADDASSVFGQLVTFTATVSPVAPSIVTPTGTVDFFIGGNLVADDVPVVGGVATFQVNSLAVASHSVQAVFNGTADYAGSSDTATQDVARAETAVTLSSSLNPSFFQQQVTFTATVSVQVPGSLIGSFAGTVTFTIDNVPVATVNVVGGVATFSTSTLAIGLHDVEAVYNGDANYNASAPDALVQDVDPNPVVFATIPASVRSGAFFTVVVHYVNSGGQPDPTFNGPITIALQSNPGGAILTGTLTVNAVGGVATFTGLSLNRAADGYTLRATAPSIPTVVSSPLNVTASRLTAVPAPKRPDVNQRFRLTFTARDITAAIAENFNGNFRARLVSKPAGARVRGRLTGTFVNGVGRLNNLRANVPGKYKFRVVINGLKVNVIVNVRGRRLS